MCDLVGYAHIGCVRMPRSVDLAMSVVQNLNWFNRIGLEEHDQYTSANTSIRIGYVDKHV